MPSAMSIMQGSTLLAEFTPTTIDFPWLHGPFHPAAAFERVRALLDRLAAPTANEDEAAKRRELFDSLDEIREAGIFVVTTDGKRFEQFTLLIDGTTARLRC